MAKEIVTKIKLQVPAGKANPAPPVGPALGQHGVNIMEFCKTFNAQTQKMGDTVVPGIIKGSGVPNKDKVGKVTRAQVKEMAQQKMPDLNAATVEAAMRTIEGSARSMGIDVVD